MMNKLVAWSASRLKAFEICPRRFYHLSVAKTHTEPESPAMEHGTLLHRAMERRVRDGVPLGVGYEKWEPLAAPWDDFRGRVFTEYRMAINAKSEPVDWFASDVDVRAIADVLAVQPERMFVVDYKTGRPRDDDEKQLDLTMAMAMCHFVEPVVCHGVLAYTMTGGKTSKSLTRDELPIVWMQFTPRVNRLRHAYETNTWPEKEGPFCRGCIVLECPYRKSPK